LTSFRCLISNSTTTEFQSLILEGLYSRSRNWIFGREPIPTLRRFCFPPSSNLTHSKGNSILVSPEHGAGVFSVWQTITDGIDTLELKRRTWDSGNPYREFLNLHLNVVETDREYPFFAIRARTNDLDVFCKDKATDLGRVFTGNYEDEELRYLGQYVNEENKSADGGMSGSMSA